MYQTLLPLLGVKFQGLPTPPQKKGEKPIGQTRGIFQGPPRTWDPFMLVGFHPYYSHVRIPIDEGIVWETYHFRGSHVLGGSWKSHIGGSLGFQVDYQFDGFFPVKAMILLTSWRFQPIWKILAKLEIFPK